MTKYNSNYSQNMFTICNNCNANVVKYNKLATGGNDPTLTKAMRFSMYIKHSRSVPTIFSQNK